MSTRRLLVFGLLVVGPALGQDPKPPDGVRLRLGTDRFREANSITAAALSPDGQRLAVCAGNQVVRVLDAATGAELRRFALGEYLRTPQLLFTPDGKHLVTGGYNGVNLWDAGTGRLVSQVLNPARDGRDGAIHLSADGKTVAVGSQYDNGSVKVLDLPAKAVVTTIKPVHNSTVQGAMSPDGGLVAVWGQHYNRGAGDDGTTARTVQICDAKTGVEKVKLVTDLAVLIQTVRFSPDGTKVAAAGNGSVQLWDVATAKVERRFAGRTGQGKHLAFSPDGKHLAAAGDDGSVQVWETATGKRAGVCEGAAQNVIGLQYRPDGQLVAWAVTANAIDLWEVPSGKRLTPAGGHAGPIGSLQFGPADKTLISSAADGRILRWDAATGAELGPFELQGRDGPRRLAPQAGPTVFSPDGKYLIANGWNNSGSAVWDVATGVELFALTGPTGAVDRSGLFAFAADSSRVTALTRYGRRDQSVPIPVWDLETGLPLPTLKGQRGDFTAAGLSTDGGTLVTTAYTYTPTGQVSEAWAWDVATGKVLSKVASPNGQTGGIVFLDDRLYVPLNPNGQVQKVFDSLTGQEVRVLEGSLSPGSNVAALSPDRRLLALTSWGYDLPPGAPPGVPGGVSGVAGPPRKVVVYETATGSARHDLTGLTGRVTAVAFSRDGKTLACGCSDTTILLWDLAGPAEKVGLLAPAELAALWGALNGAGAKPAEQAMRKLAARPAEALPYLAAEVQPVAVPAVDETLIARRIADLDAPRFPVRERATRDLERLGGPARAAVVAALKQGGLSPEMRERLEKLKGKMDQPTGLDEWVRPLRAVEVLERIGSAGAVAQLKALAGGGDAPSTRAARAALGRLGK